MKKIFFFLLFISSIMHSQEFLDFQLSQPRVLQANTEKFQTVKTLFESKHLVFPNNQIFWRAFKWNKVLELWAFSPDSNHYILVKSYPICEIVGDLGPKRQEGDFQIPEGFYNLSNFNPNSKYYLSLRVNYPNISDSILGKMNHLGGDIYIHGECETVGCIPMTNNLIQDIYIISMYAKSAGQDSIPIHIFPTKMTVKNVNKLKHEYFNGDVNIIKFWTNIKEGYDWFEKKRLLPVLEFGSDGRYLFN